MKRIDRLSSRRRLIVAGGAALVALAMVAPAVVAAPRVATIDSDWGLRTAGFSTPAGEIFAYLPGVLAAGDFYSLTVGAVPRGDGEERLRNLEELSRHSLVLGDDRVPVGDAVLRGRLRADAGAAAKLVLEDSAGARVGELEVPLLQRAVRPPAELAAPRIGHVGDAVVLRGPFDGDLATTEVSFAGRPVPVLAESAREAIVEVPRDLLGATELTVRENALDGSFPFRAIRIEVEAPAGRVAEEETVRLRARVLGLDGLDEEILLLAINRTPEIVRLEGGLGGVLRHRVRPGEVAADGSHSFDIDLTGQEAGEFDLVLAAAERDPVAAHTVNVTSPPHAPDVTSPDHATNVSWPPGHQPNVSFPPHTTNISWPPTHLTNHSWPVHVRNNSAWTFPVGDAEPAPHPGTQPLPGTEPLQTPAPVPEPEDERVEPRPDVH
jgi:hypothetical protein